MNTIRAITHDVARFRGVPYADILAPGKARPIVRPRQEAMYLARDLTDASYPTIGLHLGNRDHSTVVHACQAVERRIETDPDYADEVARMREVIRVRRRDLLPTPADEVGAEQDTSLALAEARMRIKALEVVIAERDRAVADLTRDLRAAETALKNHPAAHLPKALMRAFAAFENARFGRGETLALNRLVEALTDLRTHFKDQEKLS